MCGIGADSMTWFGHRGCFRLRHTQTLFKRRDFVEMEMSWDLRSQVCMARGRGWWNVIEVKLAETTGKQHEGFC